MENHLKNWVFSIAMFNDQRDQRVSSKPTAQPQRIFYPQPCRHLPEGFRSPGGSLVQLMPWGFSNAQRRQQKTIGIFCWITADLGDWWTGDQLYLAVGHRWVTVGFDVPFPIRTRQQKSHLKITWSNLQRIIKECQRMQPPEFSFAMPCITAENPAWSIGSKPDTGTMQGLGVGDPRTWMNEAASARGIVKQPQLVMKQIPSLHPRVKSIDFSWGKQCEG